MTFKSLLDNGTAADLLKAGFGKFDTLHSVLADSGKPTDGIDDAVLWLIPANKYDEIPNDYPVIDIFGEQTGFAGRSTCTKSDTMMGFLPIGVLRTIEDSENLPAVENAQLVFNDKLVINGSAVNSIALESVDMYRLPANAVVAVEASLPNTVWPKDITDSIDNMFKRSGCKDVEDDQIASTLFANVQKALKKTNKNLMFDADRFVHVTDKMYPRLNALLDAYAEVGFTIQDGWRNEQSMDMSVIIIGQKYVAKSVLSGWYVFNIK